MTTETGRATITETQTLTGPVWANSEGKWLRTESHEQALSAAAVSFTGPILTSENQRAPRVPPGLLIKRSLVQLAENKQPSDQFICRTLSRRRSRTCSSGQVGQCRRGCCRLRS